VSAAAFVPVRWQSAPETSASGCQEVASALTERAVSAATFAPVRGQSATTFAPLLSHLESGWVVCGGRSAGGASETAERTGDHSKTPAPNVGGPAATLRAARRAVGTGRLASAIQSVVLRGGPIGGALRLWSASGQCFAGRAETPDVSIAALTNRDNPVHTGREGQGVAACAHRAAHAERRRRR
jgi:hypothetical protein